MEEFDLATYLSAIAAVGTPIFLTIVYVIKKAGPYMKKWLDKILFKFDEMNENFDCHKKESDAEKKEIVDRLKKGDDKFEVILDQIQKESHEQSKMLEFMNENRSRIIKLEEQRIMEERKQLEYDKKEFEEKGEC